MADLAQAGFTHLHLANNHALDQGPEALDRTRDLLPSTGLNPMGDPSWEAEPSVEAVWIGSDRAFLVPLNATEPYFQLSKVELFLGGLRALNRRTAFCSRSPFRAGRCELLPLEGRPGHPRVAEPGMRSQALASLAAKSSPELGLAIQVGSLVGEHIFTIREW